MHNFCWFHIFFLFNILLNLWVLLLLCFLVFFHLLFDNLFRFIINLLKVIRLLGVHINGIFWCQEIIGVVLSSFLLKWQLDYVLSPSVMLNFLRKICLFQILVVDHLLSSVSFIWFKSQTSINELKAVKGYLNIFRNLIGCLFNIVCEILYASSTERWKSSHHLK